MTSSRKNSAAVRWLISFAIALPAWLLTPVAWADCPAGSACYTAREAQVCLVCLDEAEELRRLAREKEAERNVMAGALGECRIQRQALQLERDDWRDMATRRPSWLWVVGVGVGALLVGVGVGVVGF